MDISYSLDNLLLAFEQSVESGLVMGINVSDQNLIVSRNGEISTFQIPLGVGVQPSTARTWNVINIDNQDVFTAFRPVLIGTTTNELNWEIFTYQPLDSALSTLYTSRNGLVIITFTIIAISVVAVLFLARGISVPLQQLTEAAETLLGGNLDVNIPVAGNDEIGTLAETLNLMSTELNRVVNNLESTVDLRTKDLQRKTLQMQTSAQVARQAAGIRDLQSLL